MNSQQAVTGLTSVAASPQHIQCQQRAVPPALHTYPPPNIGQQPAHQQVHSIQQQQQSVRAAHNQPLDYHGHLQTSPGHLQVHGQSQPSAPVHNFHEQELTNAGHSHQHQTVLMGHQHQMMVHRTHQQRNVISQHSALRIEQSSSHMHPAPPAPAQQPQRVFIQQQPMATPQVLAQLHPHESPLQPQPPFPQHPHLYVGSQRYTASILAELELQPNISQKQKYRDLKKKFKYLVYENEYYQEELRNLQRKLLKLSRDKNFLLDRLGQYEQLSESSDDSDVSTKTIEDRGVVRQKKKPKQLPSRKRAAPNAGGGSNGQGPSKRVQSNKNTPAKPRASELTKSIANQLNNSIFVAKKEVEKNSNDNISTEYGLAFPISQFGGPQQITVTDGKNDKDEATCNTIKMESKDYSSAHNSNSTENLVVSTSNAK